MEGKELSFSNSGLCFDVAKRRRETRFLLFLHVPEIRVKSSHEVFEVSCTIFAFVTRQKFAGRTRRVESIREEFANWNDWNASSRLSPQLVPFNCFARVGSFPTDRSLSFSLSPSSFSLRVVCKSEKRRSIVLFAFPRSFVISRRLVAPGEEGLSGFDYEEKGVSNHQQLFGIAAYNERAPADWCPAGDSAGRWRGADRVFVHESPPPPSPTEIPSTLIIIMRIRWDLTVPPRRPVALVSCRFHANHAGISVPMPGIVSFFFGNLNSFRCWNSRNRPCS